MREYLNGVALGARLEALRIKKGFSQGYVADKLGMNQQKLSRIEKAKNAYIDEKTMHDLAFLYNVTIEEIYKQPEETIPVFPPEKKPEKTPARTAGKTNELLALLSMLMEKTEAEVIDEAVLLYAEEINFKELIRKRFMREE